MGSRIYIGRLNYEVRERDLEKFFKGYGRIKEILIKNGFGFVEFDDYRDAEDAVYDLNGKELLGDRVTIEHARGSPRGNDMYRDRNRGYRAPMQNRRRGQGGGRDKRYGPPTRTEYRLIVENLSSRVSWQDLKDYMRQAGEVTYADAHKQRRNEGVVEFATFSDMKNAIEKLDDTDLSGRHIKLVEDKSRGRGRRSRSRSRSKSSRSHSRSRSRSRSKSHSMSRSRSRSRSKSASKARSNRSLSHKKSGSRSPSPRRDRDSRNRGSRDRNSRDRASRDRNSRDRASRDRNSRDRASRDRNSREKGSRDRDSRSRSKSNKSRSRSRSKSVEKRSRTPSPVQKIDDASNSADEKK